MWFAGVNVAPFKALLAGLSLLSIFQGVSLLKFHSGYSNYSLPEGFIFGVSTAAYQIEGAWDEDGKGPSMWDTYLHKNPNFTLDGSNGDVATDSYHQWREDVKLIQNLGVKYYRMSVSWSRILPHGTANQINKAGAKYYRDLFKELLRVGITPMVTLFHWDLPQVFMDFGGWTNPLIVDYFEDYARVLFTLYGDIVKIWTTINEPLQHCTRGYGEDAFAPALNQSGIGDYLCGHYMLLSHARAYRLYDKQFRPFQHGIIGLTLDVFMAEPKNASNPDDYVAAEKYMQMRLGRFAHPIFSEDGDYPPIIREMVDSKSAQQGYKRSRLPYFTPEEVYWLKGSSDFFGINHYTTYLTTHSKMEKDWNIPSHQHDMEVAIQLDPTLYVPGLEWLAVYPPGMRKLLNWMTEEYGTKIPIIVTENGVCDDGSIEDYDRVDYYNEYINQMLLAIYEDNCNVQGYFAWTLMDDFEWNDGYISKFGLYHVNFSSPERTRTPKLSVYNLREIARTGRVNFDYIQRPMTVKDVVDKLS